jgi:hypothetical protein
MHAQARVSDTHVGLGALVDDYNLEGAMIAGQYALKAGIELLRPSSSRDQHRNLHRPVDCCPDRVFLIVPMNHLAPPKSLPAYLTAANASDSVIYCDINANSGGHLKAIHAAEDSAAARERARRRRRTIR